MYCTLTEWHQLENIKQSSWTTPTQTAPSSMLRIHGLYDEVM